jgi:hypothetical protein
MVNSLLKSSTSMVPMVPENHRTPRSPPLPYREAMSSQSTENDDWYGFLSFGTGCIISKLSSHSSKKSSSSNSSGCNSASSHEVVTVSSVVTKWSIDSTLLFLAGVPPPIPTANGVFRLV